MRIQNNISAMNSHRHLSKNNSALSKNLEKLSSGYDINRASDNAAGLAISEKMRAQITGLESAELNAQDGISLVQTAEGALMEVHSMLNRLVELSMKASNGTYSERERLVLQDEVDALLDEIDRISEATNFNEIDLLNTEAGDFILTGDTIIEMDYILFGSKMPALTSDNFMIGASGMQEGACISFVQLDSPLDAFGSPIQETGYIEAYYDLDTGDIEFSIMGNWDIDGSGGLVVTERMLQTALQNAIKDATPYATSAELAVMNEIVVNTSGTITAVAGTMEEAWIYGTEYEEAGIVFGGGIFGAEAYPGFSWAFSNNGYNNIIMDFWNIDNILCANTFDGMFHIEIYEGSNLDQAKETGIYVEIIEDELLFYLNGTAGQNISDEEIQNAIRNAIIIDSDNYMDMRHVIFKTADGNGITFINDSISTNTNMASNFVNMNFIPYLGKSYVQTPSATTIAYTVPSQAEYRFQHDTEQIIIQVGNTSDEYQRVYIDIFDMSSWSLGIGELDLTTIENALDSLDLINDAIDYVSTVRSYFGAKQNRLDHTISSLGVSVENIQDAESRIRDVDMAKEMMAYTTNNILVQSAQAMLAQANQVPQGVLQLLQ